MKIHYQEPQRLPHTSSIVTGMACVWSSFWAQVIGDRDGRARARILEVKMVGKGKHKRKAECTEQLLGTGDAGRKWFELKIYCEVKMVMRKSNQRWRAESSELFVGTRKESQRVEVRQRVRTEMEHSHPSAHTERWACLCPRANQGGIGRRKSHNTHRGEGGSRWKRRESELSNWRETVIGD